MRLKLLNSTLIICGLLFILCYPVNLYAEILFSENFEDINLTAKGWYDVSNTPDIVYDSDKGSNILEFNFANTGAVTPNTRILRHLFTDTDTVYVKYSIKYSSSWKWPTSENGPHQLYLVTNANHEWIGPAFTHLTAYLEHYRGSPNILIQDGENIDQSRINQDLTQVTENRSVAGCNGTLGSNGNLEICYSMGSDHNNGRFWQVSNPKVTYGIWHTVQICYKLNDIVNGKGVANGWVKYWFDGNLVINHEDVLLRTAANPAMKFNQIILAPYFGQGVPNSQSFRIDDLIISDSYIGGGSSEKPAAPTGLKVVEN